MIQNLADLYKTNPVKACELALRRTELAYRFDMLEFGRMRATDIRMQSINKLLDMHGVEAIRGNSIGGYWMDVVALYANAGDSYAVTVVCFRGEPNAGGKRIPTFRVSTVDFFVERNSAKYGIK